MTQTETYLTVDEIAERMRVARNTVINLIDRGELPATQFGRQWRVLASDLEEYLKRKRNVSRGKK